MTLFVRHPLDHCAFTSSARVQRGLASVLTIVLVGMVLMASVMAANHYLSGRQAQGMSTHAQTQAQHNAWTAAQILHAYFKQLDSNGQLGDLLKKSTAQPIDVQLTSAQLQGLMSARITAMQAPSSQPGHITAQVTGIAAQGSRAQASSSLQVVYEIAPSQQTSCASPPFFVKGSLNISGDKSGVISEDGELIDIYVTGDLSIASATQALVSACATGSITISGGGVKENGKLYSEKDITISSSSPIKNADIWGRNISITNIGAGTQKAIRAGAYKAYIRDVSNSSSWGFSYVNGDLVGSSNKKVIPKVTGTTSNIIQVFHEANGSAQAHWLIDLAKLSINKDTGGISNIHAAAQSLVKNPNPLPQSGFLSYHSIYGGDITLHSQDAPLIWGEKSKKPGGSATSGLPGVPYCGMDMEMADIDDFKQYANYIFTEKKEEVIRNGRLETQSTPVVIIKDVKRNGVSLDGTYTIGAQNSVLDSLLYCEGKPCALNTKWTFNEAFKKFPSGIFWFDGDTTIKSGLDNGIVGTILSKTQKTIISSDGKSQSIDYGKTVFSTDYGPANKVLKSPSHANLETMCAHSAAKPVNLCTAMCVASQQASNKAPTGVCKSIIQEHESNVSNAASNPPALDAYSMQKLIELSKMSIVTDGALELNGWTVHGNVQTGRVISNNADTTRIYGTVASGLTTQGGTNSLFHAGGIIVTTKDMTPEQGVQLGSCEAAADNKDRISIKWSRYL